MAEALEAARLKLAKQDRTEANELLLHCSMITSSALAAAKADGDPNHFIFEVGVGPHRRSSSSTFPSSSIKGAIYVDMTTIDTYPGCGSPPTAYGDYNLKAWSALRGMVEKIGLTVDSTCVAYPSCYSAETHNNAIICTRFLWSMASCGVKRVLLLEGGLARWVSEGRPTVSATSPRRGPSDFLRGQAGLHFPLRPELVATTAQVASVVAAMTTATSTSTTLADVRSWREFVGEAHEYVYHVGLGRIPGARWAHWGPSTYVGGDLWRTSDDDADEGTLMRDLEDVRALWAAWGIQEPKVDEHLIFYCGSGWRSAYAWFLSQLLGFSSCSSYDGGMLEYTHLSPMSAELEVTTGEPTPLPIV